MPSDQTRLESWKEIAAYLNREVRTARRWEKERGLPVHRIPGKRSGVYALAPEIDAWLKTEANNGANGKDPVEVGAHSAPSIVRRIGPWLAAFATLLATAVLLRPTATRSAAPRLSHPVRITNDGWLKWNLIGGGPSLLFVTPGAVKRIDDGGGHASVIPLPSSTFEPLDASRDGARVLFSQDASEGCKRPLWVAPITGGPPKRLADLCADAAAWSPDGNTLAYAVGRDLYLATAEGGNPHRLAVLPFGGVSGVRWSPDGKRLRLTLTERQGSDQFERLWEVNLSEATFARVLAGWSLAPLDREDGGDWTRDGRFFIFAGTHQGTPAIWGIRDDAALPAFRDAIPFELARPLEGVGAVALSRDGKKVFASLPLPRRGELFRFDARVGQFLPYGQMSGLSAGQLAYSPGKRVAYVTYPEPSVWTMNADGTDRRPLASSGALPQWSPDGQRIAYMGWDKPNTRTRIRVIPASGGQPEEPVQWPGWQGAPNWASGGAELIFGENGPYFPIAASCSLHVFDFKTGKTTDLPGTSGLWTPRVCPTGRYIAAMTADNGRLVLYDRRTAAVAELLASPEGRLGDNPVWSADGRFVYIDAPFSHDPAVYRIRISDRRVERFASLSGVRHSQAEAASWIGLAPDGSLLAVNEAQGSEIYAWDFVAP